MKKIYLLLFGLLLIGLNNNHTSAQELDTSTVIKKIEHRKNGLVEVEYTLPVWREISEQMLVSFAFQRWGKGKSDYSCNAISDTSKCKVCQSPKGVDIEKGYE